MIPADEKAKMTKAMCRIWLGEGSDVELLNTSFTDDAIAPVSLVAR